MTTPQLTKFEIAEMQVVCKEAWTAAQRATGLERMKLVHKAFPFAISGGANPDGGCLRICWSERYNSFWVSDSAGFITLVPESEADGTIFAAIGMEANEKGSFREMITGKKPLKRPPVPKIEPKKKVKLSLKDLEL